MTISYQMSMEKKGVAPFSLNYEMILPALKEGIVTYKEKLKDRMDLEGQELDRSLWEEMVIENEINMKYYGINLL